MMTRLITFFIFSVFILFSCSSPKSESKKGDQDNLKIVENSKQEETKADEKKEILKVVEGDPPQDPNLYMDPFDPDFISGKWESEDQNGFSFSAWFYVEDGYISGQYCAMNEDASRIDCGTQDEVDMCYLKSPYLVGKKILEIDVVSCYAMKKGKATIEPYGDGDIKWKLTESPGTFGVDHFAPDEAILFKTSFDPWD